MKFLVVGSGAMGSVAVKHMAGCKEIDEILVGDLFLERAKKLASEMRSDKASPIGINAADGTELRKALKGVDVVINAAVATLDLQIMEAALEVGVHYMDLSSLPELQLPQDRLWKDAGLTAFLGAGEDPGISNVYARYAADQMDSVESIKIRDGDVVSSERYPIAPVWSPETFLKEVLSPATYFQDGEIRSVPPFSGHEIYPFPPPVGPQPVYLMEHEEQVTLPRFIGKGVRYVDMKLAVDRGLVETLKTLQSLGLLSEDPKSVMGLKVMPRDLLMAILPQPVDLVGQVEGFAMILVEVTGEKNGEERSHILYSGLSHSEASSRYGATATAYLTGTGTGIFATLMAQGKIRQKGVVAPECIDPEPFLRLLSTKGITTRELVRTERLVEPKGKQD